MKLSRKQERVLAYAAAVAIMILGGVLIKREIVDGVSGASVVGVGAYIVGSLRQQALPPEPPKAA